MGTAGICHACQLDIVQKKNNHLIFCKSCNATWTNTAKTSCPDCVIGKLAQDYPNCIYCKSCFSKWYNQRLNTQHQFGKNIRSYRSHAYAKARK